MANDVRLQLDAARRRAHSLRLKIKGLEKHINTTTKFDSAEISEKSLAGRRKRLAEAEADIERLEQELPQRVTHVVSSTPVEAATGPEYEAEDDLTIPPFLRRN